MSRPLQASEPNRVVTIETNYDWDGNGYTLWLRVTEPADIGGGTKDISLAAVDDEPTKGRFTTSATSFPGAGGWEFQAIAKASGVDDLRSKPKRVRVERNSNSPTE